MAQRYYRRGHWVNMPSKRGSKSSAWLIGGVIALVLYLITQAGGGDPEPRPQPTAPASTAPAQTP